jgi:hypothetical protein
VVFTERLGKALNLKNIIFRHVCLSPYLNITTAPEKEGAVVMTTYVFGRNYFSLAV